MRVAQGPGTAAPPIAVGIAFDLFEVSEPPTGRRGHSPGHIAKSQKVPVLPVKFDASSVL